MKTSIAALPGRAPVRTAPRRDPVSLASDLLPLCDIACMLLAAAFATQWLVPGGSRIVGADAMAPASWFAALLAPFMLYDARFGSKVMRRRTSFPLFMHLLRFGAFAAVALTVGAMSGATADLPRGGLVLWVLVGLSSTTLARAAAAAMLRRLRRLGHLSEAVAVVGAGPMADRLLRRLRRDRRGGIEVLGLFDDAAATTSPGVTPVSGSIAQLIDLGTRRRIDWIVLAQPPSPSPDWQHVLHRLQTMAVPLGLCPQFVGKSYRHRGGHFVGHHVAVGLLAGRPIQRWDAVAKRAEDLLLGGALTLLLLPLLALIALAIRLDSPGPVVFRQRRHALDNREFEIFKFRTMRQGAQGDTTTLRQTRRGDERITRIGRFLRAASLDELPQLFNVLQGTMSLVGPRPHATQMRTANQLGCEITAQYAHRHRVKPGITGWAQVNGARGATDNAAQLQRRVELDLYYIDHWSLLLDLKILALTAGVVIQRTNAF